MADKVRELSRMAPEDLAVYGDRALSYYRTYFTKEKCMGILDGVLKEG